MPAIASARSDWPLPSTPATPTISPRRTERNTSCSGIRPGRGAVRTSRSSSTFSPGEKGFIGTSVATSRPTISSESLRTFISEVSPAPVTTPLRMIVTRSHSSMTSSSLWEM